MQKRYAFPPGNYDLTSSPVSKNEMKTTQATAAELISDCFLPNIILQSLEKPDIVCAALVWNVFHMLGKQAIF